MKGETRLIHASVNPRTRDLLRAGCLEQPSLRSLEATAAVLGLGGSSLVGGAVARALEKAEDSALFSPGESGAAQAGSSMASTVGASAMPSVLAVAGKWLVVGALAGGGASAGYRVLAEDPKPSSTTRAGPGAPPRTAVVPGRALSSGSSPLKVVAVPRRSPATLKSPSGPPSAVSLPVPALPERGAKVPATLLQPPTSPDRPTPASSLSAPDASGALAHETALIDAARAALARGDLPRVARELDQYDTSRRVGVLDREALLLRIEVALGHGDMGRARTLAERFVALYPGDPHWVRLRGRLGLERE